MIQPVDPIQDTEIPRDLERIADSLETITRLLEEFAPIVRALYGPTAAGPAAWAVRRSMAKEARNGNRN